MYNILPQNMTGICIYIVTTAMNVLQNKTIPVFTTNSHDASKISKPYSNYPTLRMTLFHLLPHQSELGVFVASIMGILQNFHQYFLKTSYSINIFALSTTHATCLFSEGIFSQNSPNNHTSNYCLLFTKVLQN